MCQNIHINSGLFESALPLKTCCQKCLVEQRTKSSIIFVFLLPNVKPMSFVVAQCKMSPCDCRYSRSVIRQEVLFIERSAHYLYLIASPLLLLPCQHERCESINNRLCTTLSSPTMHLPSALANSYTKARRYVSYLRHKTANWAAHLIFYCEQAFLASISV